MNFNHECVFCNCHDDVAFFGCAKEIVTSFGYVMMYVLGGNWKFLLLPLGIFF